MKRDLGMVSHKMSNIIIFGLRNLNRKFHKKIIFCSKKLKQTLILWFIFGKVPNFEEKILLN